MTTRHTSRPSKAQAPPAEPENKRMQSARKLEMFGPDIVITVPLSILPEYLELYQLQPNGIQEPQIKPKDGPGEAILLVKRIQKTKERNDQSHPG